MAPEIMLRNFDDDLLISGHEEITRSVVKSKAIFCCFASIFTDRGMKKTLIDVR